jgi:HK97 gp10 family phage protein
MARDVNIKGGKELNAFLQTLPVKIERNIMRSALRFGARTIANEAKNNVPVESGDLRKSIRTGSSGRRGKVEAYVRAGNKKAWYGLFVEMGTAAHMIKTKNRSALKFAGADGMVFTKNAEHPGAKAKPFLRPALDNKADEAIAAVAQRVRERLTKEGINIPAPEGSDT